MTRPIIRTLLVAVLGICAVVVTHGATAGASPCVGGADTTRAPRGDIAPYWRQTFVDDFDRCDLGPEWKPYSGQPGGNPNSMWDPSRVRVDDGILHLDADRRDGRWITGGVSNSPVTQQYGRWEVRFRVSRSDEIGFYLLLWPFDDRWPPEIGFLESIDGTRTAASGAMHYTERDGSQGRQMRAVRGDFSRWTIATVEWIPGHIRMRINGETWWRISDARVPATPMWLALQTEAGACARAQEWNLPMRCPRAGTPDTSSMEVDWVSVWTPMRP